MNKKVNFAKMVGEGANFSPNIFTKFTFYSFTVFIYLFIYLFSPARQHYVKLTFEPSAIFHLFENSSNLARKLRWKVEKQKRRGISAVTLTSHSWLKLFSGKAQKSYTDIVITLHFINRHYYTATYVIIQ